MNKVFTKNGWADYVYWQTEDRKTIKKINQLIEDIARNGNEGIGKPEPLTGNLTGFWSRRINDKDNRSNRFGEIVRRRNGAGIQIAVGEIVLRK